MAKKTTRQEETRLREFALLQAVHTHGGQMATDVAKAADTYLKFLKGGK